MKVSIEIADDIIADVLDQGAIYGINDWGECDANYDYILNVIQTDGLALPLKEIERSYIGGTVHDDELIACHVLYRKDIAKGLSMMTGVLHGYLSDILSGSYDAWTGDVLFQLSAFGEIRYN